MRWWFMWVVAGCAGDGRQGREDQLGEDCLDGVDDDRDGDVDCDDPDCSAVCDRDQDGYVDVALGGQDCDDLDGEVNPAAAELCNGIDDDCDGLTDDEDGRVAGFPVWFRDRDGDGFGDEAIQLDSCVGPAGTSARDGDCDDEDDAVNPGAPERCNGIDDDCDGAVDDDDPSVDERSFPDLWIDADRDGYGSGRSVAGSGCTPIRGEADNDEDCDDDDPWIHPDAPETCGDGLDQDCDQDVDCADLDCVGDAACCADAAIAGVGWWVGSTLGAGNDFDPSCEASNAPDVALSWTPPAPGRYTLDTWGSNFDTVLTVLDGCNGPELECNDDVVVAVEQWSFIELDVTAVRPYLIVVDGWGNESGTFELGIY